MEIYESKPLYGVMCYPSLGSAKNNSALGVETSNKIKALKKALSFDSLDQIISDLNKSYFVIIGCVFGTIIISYLFLYLIRWFSGIVIWVFIVTIIILSLLFGGLLLGNWYLHT